MNVKELQESGRIIYQGIGGSHAYGLNTPTSDIDIRGIFINPIKEKLSLPFCKGSEQIDDDKHDTSYYELARFMSLAKDCNPNIAEYLFFPNDCIQIKTPIAQKLIDNRHLFMSTKAYYTFSGYAYSQVGRAKGENKWINNPKPEFPPQREDFCWIVPINSSKPVLLAKAIKDGIIEPLSNYHCAGMEHVSNMYRLYYYGDEAEGVFKNNAVASKSIPIEHETTHFRGFLIYNEVEYDKTFRDWKNYWEWVKNRNVNRWALQESGKMDYDVKNLMHTMRLLLSSKNILTKGEPIIRFTGEPREFLMKIRNGGFTYEYLMNYVEEQMVELKELYENCTIIPKYVDEHKINELYLELIGG